MSFAFETELKFSRQLAVVPTAEPTRNNVWSTRTPLARDSGSQTKGKACSGEKDGVPGHDDDPDGAALWT